MRKILSGALVAGMMVSSAVALEVYKDDANDAYVDIYGTLRGYVGYGNAQGNTIGITDDNFLFGIQGNSRVGIKAGYGGFSTQVEIGANEVTVRGNSADAGIGLRQAWGSYSFGAAGTILAGKADTLTSMGGFSSDIFNNDGGAAGFGGLTTSNRRFQVQYKLPFGLSFALSENEAAGNQLYSGVTWRVPRISVGYDIKSPDLTARVAATYAFANKNLISGISKDVNIFSVVAGVKPKLGDGWLTVMLSYGLNDDKTGEQSIGSPGIIRPTGWTSKITVTGKPTLAMGTNNDIDNLHRVSGLLELGYNITPNFAALIGGGYQWAKSEVTNSKSMDTYTVYVQAPYKVSKFFSIIPQIGWYGLNTNETEADSGKKARRSAILAAAQLRFTF